MTNGVAPSGWYQDPTGQGDGRYWNGTSWTESVDRGGVTVNVAIDPSQAQVPPIAGTEISIPASTPAAQTVPARRSPVGAILGLVFLVVAIVLIVVLVNNNDDSSNDGPPTTDVAPATEAPAPPDTGGG